MFACLGCAREALPICEDLLARAMEGGDLDSRANFFAVMANVHWQLGERDTAMRYLGQVADIREPAGYGRGWMVWSAVTDGLMREAIARGIHPQHYRQCLAVLEEDRLKLEAAAADSASTAVAASPPDEAPDQARAADAAPVGSGVP